MSQESKRTYTIRLPEAVAARVEGQAESSGIAPTTLIQSLVADAFALLGKAAVGGPASSVISKLDALGKAFERLEENAGERYGRLLFELVKTRSAFLHALDQSLGEPAVDEIIEASEKTARDYIDRLGHEEGNRQ
ncbi:hypothetical protein [Candidatus Binatus sp.]|uniref:hypothetical protein n=1 Tax=Candidatus Binatus sp. TaxID=2811406 RepID=UPI003C9F4830